MGAITCKKEILDKLFSYEIKYSIYSKFTYLGNVDGIIIPRTNGSTIIGYLIAPNFSIYIHKDCIKLNINFSTYLNEVYQECCKLISYNKLSKYNINLPLILLNRDKNININKKLHNKFKKDKKYIFYTCLLTNISTRLVLISYYHEGIFSKLSTELVNCILKFL